MEPKAIRENHKSECSPEYPPCEVCRGAGDGKHYGVYTCQSCKTFFRRYLKKEKPYVCSRNGDCKVVNSSHANCSACRVQKCKKVGMCVEGVKTGRRTLTERNKTIMEVNRLQTEKKRSQTRFEILQTEAQSRIKKIIDQRPDLMDLFPWAKNGKQGANTLEKCSECEGMTKSAIALANPISSSPMSTDNLIYLLVQEALTSSFQSSHDNIHTEGKDRQSNLDPDTNREENFIENLLIEYENENNVPLPDELDVGDYDDDGCDMDFIPLSPESLEECFTDLMEWTYQESQFFNQSTQPYEESQDRVIQDLVGSFKGLKVHSHLTDDEIKKKLTEEYEKMQLIEAAIGPMRSMTNEEYIEFFLTTGLDIEGRVKYLMQMKTHLTQYMRRVIQFAHKIPGFRGLLPVDQASLIRGCDIKRQRATVAAPASVFGVVFFYSRFKTQASSNVTASRPELRVILSNRAVDPDLEVWMVWDGDVFDVNRSWMFGKMEIRKKWFSLAKEIRDLNLSTEEMAVVMGMSLTFTDRCSLCQPMEVDKINLNLTSHLQTLLQRRYKDKASNQLCKVMELFVNLRSFSHERDAQLREFVTNEVVTTHFPSIKSLQALIID